MLRERARTSETTFSIPSLSQPANQSNQVGVAITPLNLSVSDPDGNTLTFAHTGLPTGLTIDSANRRITGTPSAAGTYNVTLFVTDALVTISRSFTWTITNPTIAPVTSATLAASLASPQNTGTAVTFTAGAAGGVNPVQYKFFVQQGGGVAQMVRDWSATTSYAWTPTTAASYTVTVWARSAGVTTDAAQATAQLAYVINTPPPAPVTSATLTSNVASPQNTGTAVTFTANGAGGVGPREYKFLVQQGGGAAQMVRGWSTTTTYAWTPSTAASYTLIVWARSAGVTTDAAQATAQMAYVINTPPPAAVTSATLGASLASPQNTGTGITFTAGAAGGVNPVQYKLSCSRAAAGRRWCATGARRRPTPGRRARRPATRSSCGRVARVSRPMRRRPRRSWRM